MLPRIHRLIALPKVSAYCAGSLLALTCAMPFHSASAQVFSLPTEFDGGGVVAMTPKYEGSRSYSVIGFPVFSPVGGFGDGFVQFRGVDDLRFRLLKLNGFEAGPLVGYRFGRDQDDGRLLRGMGDVDGGIVVGGYAGYRFGALMPFVSYHHQVTGDDTGSVARFGLEYASRLSSVLDVRATAGTTWASADYNESFFGVTTIQAARTGLGVYQTEAGIKDVFIGGSADLRLDSRWTLKLMGRYTYLTSDAHNSPVVETGNQFFGGLGLAYRFSLK